MKNINISNATLYNAVATPRGAVTDLRAWLPNVRLALITEFCLTVGPVTRTADILYHVC